MPGRRVPPEIMACLGKCRQPESLVEKVIEQCGLGKMMGDADLSDFDPLIVVMRLVADEIEGLRRSVRKPKGAAAWVEAVRQLQADRGILEHNGFIPCRFCDTAFEPVVDENLLGLFLAWYGDEGTPDLLAIHRCAGCGGTIEARRTKKYAGDVHTPAPGTVADDEEWAERLLSKGGWTPDADDEF